MSYFIGKQFVQPPEPVGGRKDVTQASSIADLQRQIERQSLMIQTLARLLIAKGVIVEQELNEWMKYVDGLDGHVDGKLRPAKAPKPCAQCNRINPYNAAKCQYCGAQMETDFLDPVKEKE